MEITINRNTPVRRFNHHWKFCVGSAHAAYALRHDYTKQLAQVRDDLGIERVRFHGIFDDSMHTIVKATDILPFPFGGSFCEHSFRQCAAAYDNVLEAGMQPFVELSFMPKHLAKLPFAKGAFYYKPIVSLPKSTAQWQAYIQQFLRFLIDRYGKSEVESWYFEVWNEPDLPFVFFDGRQRDYFRLYRATAETIKRVDDKIRVGGPATSGSRWIKDFLDYCKITGAPVDFVSTHQYAGDPIGGVEHREKSIGLNVDILAALKRRRSLDRENILDLYRAFMGVADAPETLRRSALTESAKNVKAIAGPLPVFYTEWNMCASFSAPCNDTSMQACYLLHSILHSQESIDGSSIWCFSDLFEEFHQFPEEFHGGFGLLTQSGIKKPSYYALQFLSDAGDRFYDIPSETDADLMVFRKGNELHVLAFLPDFENTGKTETFTLKIRTEKPKRCVLNRINAKTANPLAIWESAGSKQIPTKQQTDELNAQSQPSQETVEMHCADGYVTIPVSLTSNEIQRIILFV